MTTETMFDLGAQRDALEALIAEQDGELTPEQEAAWDAINAKFEDKVESAALLSRERRAHAAAVEAEATRLSERATALLNDAKRIEALIANRMQAFGRDKVKGVLVTVAFQANPPSVQEVVPCDQEDLRNVAMIAPAFVRHTPETFAWDRDAIKRAAKAGTLPPDVSKRVAVVQTTGLRIR